MELEDDGYQPKDGRKYLIHEGFPSHCTPGGHDWRLIESSIQPFDLHYNTTDWYCVHCRRVERIIR